MIIQLRTDEGAEDPDWEGTLDEFLQSGQARGLNKTTVRALKFLRPHCTLEIELDRAETLYVTRID